MKENLRALWRWLSTTRHTAWLEAEVERLRAECAEARRQNWALVNSLVTTAGAPLPQEVLRSAAASPGFAGQGARPDKSPGETGAAAPEARRSQRGHKSWHQTARALEIESAREFRSGAAQSKGA
ncbi:MAG TPA: hypothetical protein VNJ52_13545 [Patescibacteria group bacterium]|nr:hypothetical protein [Patescibacteria group bacterium]